MKLNFEDTWLEITLDYLNQLSSSYEIDLANDLENDERAEIKTKLKELKSLIKYLNKTN